MKTLMLLRHAKSSWSEPDLDDEDRPLTGRGKKAARQMGALLREKGLVPDLILCSTAKRAKKTAELAGESAAFGGKIELHDALYLASARKLLSQARAHTPETVERLLLVAHNPGMEDLVELLANRDEGFPTAALAIFDVSIERWSDLDVDMPCQLKALYRPKEL